jgi:drug/metabolite transporter (DMT)-like permease
LRSSSTSKRSIANAQAALSPAMTAIMAIPILGEWPRPTDWIAIAAISLGVYIVSGGSLPQRPLPWQQN